MCALYMRCSAVYVLLVARGVEVAQLQAADCEGEGHASGERASSAMARNALKIAK